MKKADEVIEIERKLKERFSRLQFTYYPSSYPGSSEIESKNKEIFKQWAHGGL
jgi:hypothetical protein